MDAGREDMGAGSEVESAGAVGHRCRPIDASRPGGFSHGDRFRVCLDYSSRLFSAPTA